VEIEMIGVLGSCNVDYHLAVTHLPSSGQTVSSLGTHIFAGGKGANQALAARRAGAEVTLVAAVGPDNDAKVAVASLVEAGVRLDHLRSVNVETGKAHVYVDTKGENFIVLTPGANRALTIHDAEVAVAAAEDGVLILQQEISDEVTEAALHHSRRKNVKSIFNISPFSASSPDLASLADIVLANEHEWNFLADGSGTDPKLPERWVAQRDQILVVTKGRHGAFLFSRDQSFHVPAPLIAPIDTVGAGDTFCGYFAASIAEGCSLHRAVGCGVIAASLACLASGAQPSIPTRAQVFSAIKSNV
jgi:ribokinase